MLILSFPWMHPEGVGDFHLERVKFLDPGLDFYQGDERFWVPEGMPMTRQDAQRYINEALAFGERVREPRDLAYLKAGAPKDFFAGTSQSLASEMRNSLQQEEQAAESLEESLLQGQMVLLLNWTLEEKILESRDMENDYREKMTELRRILDAEEEGEASSGELYSGQAAGRREERLLSWSGLLPWFLLFLPRDGALFLTEEGIGEEMREHGIDWEPLLEVAGYENLKGWARRSDMALDICREAGWKLMGSSRPDPRKPWLEEEYCLLCPRR